MTEQHDLRILGAVVGTYEEWEYVDDITIQFTNVKLNDLGQKWAGREPDGEYDWLAINFVTGEIQCEGLEPQGELASWEPCWHDLVEVL